MPAKLKRCVEQIMKKQGVSKERAFAICTAALDGITYDANSVLKATIDDVTGFLTAPVTLARTGVQYYMGYELGLTDRAMDKIGVFRSPEQVFHADAVSSFENMVVTNDHPSVLVNIDNVKDLQTGQVSSITKLDNTIVGVVTITDKSLIKKIQSGKKEVSVGYLNDLKESAGEYQGDKYEFIQTNIKGNHLAIVDAGRCGPACKLTIDDLGGKHMIITIDGKKITVEDESLAQAILNDQAAYETNLKLKDADIEKAKKEKDEEEAEKLKAMKEKDKAEAAKDALINDSLTADQTDLLVQDRAILIADARLILGDKYPKDCKSCDTEIKAAVITHVMEDVDLSGKSKDYIAAMYDMAVKKHKKGQKSVDTLVKDLLKDKDGNPITRDSARNKYMSDMGLNQEV